MNPIQTACVGRREQPVGRIYLTVYRTSNPWFWARCGSQVRLLTAASPPIWKPPRLD